MITELLGLLKLLSVVGKKVYLFITEGFITLNSFIPEILDVTYTIGLLSLGLIIIYNLLLFSSTKLEKFNFYKSSNFIYKILGSQFVQVLVGSTDLYTLLSTIIFGFFIVFYLYFNLGFDLWFLISLSVLIWYLWLFVRDLKLKEGVTPFKIFRASVIFLPFFVYLFIFSTYLKGNDFYKLNQYCEVPTDLNKITCNYSNGYYVGQLKGFKREGEGTYFFKSGSKYEGQWKRNLRHGS